jgi:hypothetical protein
MLKITQMTASATIIPSSRVSTSVALSSLPARFRRGREGAAGSAALSATRVSLTDALLLV